MTDASPSAGPSPVALTSPAPISAPAVVAVLVTRDPGPWFEDVLASLAAQTYKQLSVLVIDAGSDEDPAARVAPLLPQARIKRLTSNPGFGAAANIVLDVVEGAAFYLLCHDDVALAPDAVRHLVEEAFRTNAGVLGPKLVDWHDPDRLRSAGGSVDKTGTPAPFAEPGELDQEQHDAVRDVFYVAGGATLVRADLFETIGGFDPGITYHGDDVDLCWRAHIAGARVVIVPDAVVRHLEALAVRRPVDDRRRLQHRHRVRSLLSCYRPWHMARVLPQALFVTFLEAMFALVSGRVRHAADVVGAWTWNLTRLPAIIRRRRRVARARTVRDAEVRELQVRGSARITAFLRGQLGASDDRLGALAATGRDLTVTLRAPLTRVALAAAAVVVALMALGSRNLFFEPVPAVGDLSAVPDSALTLLRAHLAGWQTSGGGVEAASPTGIGAMGLAGLLAAGSTSLARKLAILALLPAGPLGMWRLTRPIGSIRAGAAAVVVYTAIPVAYNALAQGSWSGLAAYASVPWMVLGLGRSMGLAPFGPTDVTADAGRPPVAAVVARSLGLGLTIALAAIISPAIVPLAVLVAAGLAIGSLVAGRTEGLGRLGLTLAGGLVVALILHLPWTVSVLTGGAGWDAIVGVDGRAPRPLAELLRFQSGPYGNTVLGWAFLVAGALPLVIGRGWRQAWAVRAWFVALAGWGTLLAAETGWLPFDLPATEILLVPAAVGMALAAALGMAAFEVDLRHYEFGWRQAASVLAAIAVLVGGVTLLPAATDGRWSLPRGDLNRALAPVIAAHDADESRILWLGHPGALPVAGHEFDDQVTLGTSDGLPQISERWAGPRHAGTERLVAALRLAADRRTTRLGHVLAPMGIRFVVVPTRSVPLAFGGRPQPPPRWLTDTLGDQLDLEQIDTDRSLLVYRNTAWHGMATQIPAGTQLPRTMEGAARTERDGWRSVVTSSKPDSFGVHPTGDGDVVTALPAGDNWTMEIDGTEARQSSAFGWAARFDVPGSGEGTLRHDPRPLLVVVTLAQPLLWVLVLIVHHRLSRRARSVASADEVDGEAVDSEPPIDPVESAAAAVAERAREATAGAAP